MNFLACGLQALNDFILKQQLVLYYILSRDEEFVPTFLLFLNYVQCLPKAIL